MRLPLEVLASVFSYLFPKVALRLMIVDRKWHDLVIKGRVPWTISPPFRTQNGTDYGLGMWAYQHPIIRPSCMVHQASGTGYLASNAVAFKFGPLPPTRLLMQTIQSMQKLKRIQMPTCIGERMGDSYSGFYQSPDLYSEKCVESVTSHADITHLAVTHLPCILSVCSFTHLTSLLISFGILDPIPSTHAVELFIQNVVEDINVLPQLQHLGLNQYTNPYGTGIAIDTIVELLQRRSGLITLSLTGMFDPEPEEIRKLLHPHCGLKSIAINADLPNDDEPWPVNEILNVSQVSLVVLCLYESRRLSKSVLWAMFVAGFEPLKGRKVEIDGQLPYIAHPFRRVGVDVVWGLTAGALFAGEVQ
jgi:hypothetical protein